MPDDVIRDLSATGLPCKRIERETVRQRLHARTHAHATREGRGRKQGLGDLHDNETRRAWNKTKHTHTHTHTQITNRWIEWPFQKVRVVATLAELHHDVHHANVDNRCAVLCG